MAALVCAFGACTGSQVHQREVAVHAVPGDNAQPALFVSAAEARSFVTSKSILDASFVDAVDFVHDVLVFVPLAQACETDATAADVLTSVDYHGGDLVVHYVERVAPISYSPGQFRHICPYPALTDGHFIAVARSSKTTADSRVTVDLQRPD